MAPGAGRLPLARSVTAHCWGKVTRVWRADWRLEVTPHTPVGRPWTLKWAKGPSGAGGQNAGGLVGLNGGQRPGMSLLQAIALPRGPLLALGCPKQTQMERNWEGSFLLQTQVPRTEQGRHSQGPSWLSLTLVQCPECVPPATNSTASLALGASSVAHADTLPLPSCGQCSGQFRS